MNNWKSIWAVVKGEPLSAEKALNRNAGIGIFLTGILLLGIVRGGKIPFTPYTLIIFGTGIFFCFSWLAARTDEVRRNELLVIQGFLGVILISAAAVWFIIQLHAIVNPEPGAAAFKGGVGCAPGLVAGAILYFGRHISDFSKTFKPEVMAYTRTLLAIGITLEVIILVKFFQAVSLMFKNI